MANKDGKHEASTRALVFPSKRGRRKVNSSAQCLHEEEVQVPRCWYGSDHIVQRKHEPTRPKLMRSDSQQKSILVPERRVFFHLSRFGEPVHLVSVAARQPAWVGPSWFAYWLGLKVPLTSRRMTLAAHITNTRSGPLFLEGRNLLTRAHSLVFFFLNRHPLAYSALLPC